jgi:hypothetical protein
VTNNNGSGFDYWIYWRFFTVTVNYNSSHIELLNDVCLTNLYEESRTVLSLLLMSESTPVYICHAARISGTRTVRLFTCLHNPVTSQVIHSETINS